MALELVHGRPGQRGFEILDLSIDTWLLLTQLAKNHGWTPPEAPRGGDPSRAQPVCNFSEWYFWGKPAQVTRSEALDLAAALTRALETPELRNAKLPSSFRKFKGATEAALADSNYARFCGLSREMVERAIKFLNQGEFEYAVWD